MSDLEAAPAKQHCLLLEFSWGDGPSRALYASWPKVVDFNAQQYNPLPEIDVQMGKQHGGTKDQSVRVKMAANVEPVASLLSGIPFPTVYCVVSEAIPGDYESWHALFYGEVRRSVRNSQGRSAVAEIEISGIKALANVRLGVVCNPTCAWVFGDQSCGIDPADVRETGSLTSAAGLMASVSGLSVQDTGYWTRGYVAFDGARVAIREDKGGGTLIMARPLPAAWVGHTLTVTPGCDKAIGTCRARWNNEEHFGGFGIAMPSYHPLFESLT